MQDDKKYYNRFGVPYESEGGYINGDVKIIVFGSMKDFDQYRRMGIALGGRVPERDMKEISRQEAENLKNELFNHSNKQ